MPTSGRAGSRSCRLTCQQRTKSHQRKFLLATGKPSLCLPVATGKPSLYFPVATGKPSLYFPVATGKPSLCLASIESQDATGHAALMQGCQSGCEIFERKRLRDEFIEHESPAAVPVDQHREVGLRAR